MGGSGSQGEREEAQERESEPHTVRFRGPVVTDVNRVEGVDEISPDATKAGRGEAHLPTAPGEGCSLSLTTFLGWHSQESCLLNPNMQPLSIEPYTLPSRNTPNLMVCESRVRQQSFRMGKAPCESQAGLSANPASTCHDMSGELPHLPEAL